MIESDRPQPQLEIAQDELSKFIDTLARLKPRREPIAEHPITIDGEQKLARISADKKNGYASLQIVDTEEVGLDNSVLYEAFIVTRDEENNKLLPTYKQGSLTKDLQGRLYDPLITPEGFTFGNVTNEVSGQVLRMRMEEQPIDEFRRFQDIVLQIQREKKARSPLARVRKIFR